jgi:hypothetical protein
VEVGGEENLLVVKRGYLLGHLSGIWGYLRLQEIKNSGPAGS